MIQNYFDLHISLSDIISIIISSVALFFSYKAIKQTNKSIELSNKQSLFDRRLIINDLFNAIIELNFSYIDSLNLDTDFKDYYRSGAGNSLKGHKALNELINNHFVQVVNHSLFVDKIRFSEADDKKEYELVRVEYLKYKSELKSKINQVSYLFSDQLYNQQLENILETYLGVLNSYNSYYYCYFNTEILNQPYRINSMIAHLEKIKKAQIVMISLISESDDIKKYMNSEMNFLR